MRVCRGWLQAGAPNRADHDGYDLHGRSGLGGARHGTGTNLNTTTMFFSGSQSAKIVTDGVGTAAFVEKTGLSLNLMGKALQLRFRVRDLPTNYRKVNQLIVFVGDSALANTYTWKFMQPTDAAGFQYTRGGEWVYVAFSFAAAPTTGTPNGTVITRVRLRTRDASIGPLTVWWDLVAVVEAKTATPFPNGVVTLAGDCDASVWSQAIPKMSHYGFSGPIFSIPDVVGAAGLLTLEQTKTGSATTVGRLPRTRAPSEPCGGLHEPHTDRAAGLAWLSAGVAQA